MLIRNQLKELITFKLSISGIVRYFKIYVYFRW